MIDSKKVPNFYRDVLTLMGGTAIAQALAILASPIVTRLYGPDAFGLSALFISIAGIISVVACLRYDMAIMLPKRDEDAANILSLSLMIVTLISALTLPAVWFWGTEIAGLLNSPGLAPYLLFMPIFVFVSGAFLALNYWNSRTGNFRRLSAARITSSIFTVCVQLGAGLTGHATGGSLIGATVIGSLASTFLLGAQIWRSNGRMFIATVNRKCITKGLRRYKKFPLYDAWGALINAASWQLPVLLLSAYFSPAIVGYYALGFMVLQVPMNLIGNAIAQVFFQRAAKAKADGVLDDVAKDAFEFLVILCSFPMLMLAIVGEDVFAAVFGSAWTEAGIFVQILSPWAFVLFISSPLSTIISVLEKQELGLKLSIANFVSRFLAIVIGGLLGSAYLAMGLFSLAGLVIYGYLCLATLTAVGIPLFNISRILLSSLRIFLPFGILMTAIELLGVNSLIIVCLFFASLVIYYLYILKTSKEINHLIGSLKYGL